MSRPRDTQRQRLYDAENAAQHKVDPTTYYRQTVPNDQLQSWVDGVLAKAPVFDRWPDKKIRVELGRHGAHANHWGTTITLGKSCRNPWVMLHEIAHCLLPGDKYAAHGPEYAGVYLFLVKTVLGKEAHTELLAKMKEKRVRRSNIAIPKPNPQRRRSRVAKERAVAAMPPSNAALREAASVIRQAAKAGLLGESTRKPRVHALATARLLEGAMTAQPIAAKRGAQ